MNNVAAPSLNRFSRLHSRLGLGGALATPPGNRSMARGTRFGGKKTPKRGKRNPRRGKGFRSSYLWLIVNRLLSEGSRVNQSPDRSDDNTTPHHTVRTCAFRSCAFGLDGIQFFWSCNKRGPAQPRRAEPSRANNPSTPTHPPIDRPTDRPTDDLSS